MSIPDPHPDTPSDLIVALEMAQLAGWVETASINADKRRRLIATLMDGAQRLAYAALERRS